MSDENRDQVEYWNGAVGQRWAASQTALDSVFAPLTDALFAEVSLPAGARVLDIGCGAGQTALIAAQRIGASGRVLAADLSAPLLAVARRRAEDRPGGDAPIDWVEADAQSYAFGESAFDQVLSRFGVMFFADSVAAFANLRRSLADGGRLTFLCWRAMAENDWVQVPREAVLPLIPDHQPTDPDAPGPFRFADDGNLVRLLETAGYRDVTCTAVDRLMTIGRPTDGSVEAATEAAAEVVVDLGPVSRLLRDREPSLREQARRVVADTLADHVRDGAVRLGAACWLVSATR